MNKETLKKVLFAVLLLGWSAIILSAFYITQRPVFLQVYVGILSTLWTISLAIILFVDSAGVGCFLFKQIRIDVNEHEQLILGAGLGLGVFGLLGYGLGVIGQADPLILLIILFAILIWFFISKLHEKLQSNLYSLFASFQEGKNGIPVWLPVAVVLTCTIGFFFSLLPPAEGFDGLLYHLALPERLLADKQILLYNIPQFWFPSAVGKEKNQSRKASQLPRVVNFNPPRLFLPP